MPASRKFPDELRERAVRMVLDALEDDPGSQRGVFPGSASSSASIPKRCAAGSAGSRSTPATGPAPPLATHSAWPSWRRRSASCGEPTRWRIQAVSATSPVRTPPPCSARSPAGGVSYASRYTSLRRAFARDAPWIDQFADQLQRRGPVARRSHALSCDCSGPRIRFADLVCHVGVELVVGVLDAPPASEVLDVAAPVPTDDPGLCSGPR